MTKPVAVYQAGNIETNALQVALSRDGKTYSREFKRHTRFGRKWNEWRETSFSEVIALGHEQFQRVDRIVNVVLP